MASDASVPNNFVAGTPSVADDVDANFAALVSWINTNAVHLDASKAFTSIPTGPASDPSSDNQLARKAYVDAKADLRVGVRLALASPQSFTAAAGVENFTWTSEIEDTHGFIAVPSTTVTVPSGYAGTYVVSCVVFAIGGGMGASNCEILMAVNGVGVPLAKTSAGETTAAATFVMPLAVGNTVRVTLDTSTNGTANAYLNMYRISA